MKIKKLHNQGNHLILDGSSKAELDDIKMIEKLLLELAKRIKMTPISEPLVVYHQAKDKSESGVTGTILLAESNITIHTYPAKSWFCLDIYSCKEFPIKEVTNFLKKELKIKAFKSQLLKRGFYGKN